ncbi:hypothetical protein D8B26_003367 [Coccidioides posadasii str. Silveira]|uniref:uncharacterized protein n=1 Tax=Coccidioides posadasii (strain RMSCC 757 / Silveira) TaxID=443226 RepID=UPI001BF04FB3|nr:hypothetical protein D8B26_003367 [Coccidioides posadasii str. Silveira]
MASGMVGVSASQDLGSLVACLSRGRGRHSFPPLTVYLKLSKARLTLVRIILLISGLVLFLFIVLIDLFPGEAQLLSFLSHWMGMDSAKLGIRCWISLCSFRSSASDLSLSNHLCMLS